MYPPPHPVTMGAPLSPAPQAGTKLHLTPPAQHCLLWPLWECCAICWPQIFYEQEDRKKYFSIDRSQACSLPLLFGSLFGDERDKVGDKGKTTLSAEPLRISPVSGALLNLPSARPETTTPGRWVGRPGSRRPGFIGPKALSPLG